MKVSHWICSSAVAPLDFTYVCESAPCLSFQMAGLSSPPHALHGTRGSGKGGAEERLEDAMKPQTQSRVGMRWA